MVTILKAGRFTMATVRVTTHKMHSVTSSPPWRGMVIVVIVVMGDRLSRQVFMNLGVSRWVGTGAFTTPFPNINRTGRVAIDVIIPPVAGNDNQGYSGDGGP